MRTLATDPNRDDTYSVNPPLILIWNHFVSSKHMTVGAFLNKEKNKTGVIFSSSSNFGVNLLCVHISKFDLDLDLGLRDWMFYMPTGRCQTTINVPVRHCFSGFHHPRFIYVQYMNKKALYLSWGWSYLRHETRSC